MAARTVRTVCPRNCYCTCGMLVTVEDNRIVRIEGDPKNPATGGKLCVKGLSYARRVSSDHRLLTPLRRLRRVGRLERVGWEEALADIAGRLDAIRQAYGPEAVLYYEGSGSHGALGQLAYAFWHQFGGCTVPFGDLCWPAGLEATRLTYGANLHNHPRLTAESRFVLLWGHNPAETNVHQMRLLLDAQDKGALVAVVDPRETDTSDACNLHVKPRPGTDAALALGMARVIVDEGLHDRAFLDAHAAGYHRYLERLRDFPLDRVAAITGLDARAIHDLAIRYATTKPALLIAGFGVQRHAHAGQAVRAVALLPALTGNVAVPGGGWQYANLASHCLQAPPLPPKPAALREGFPVARLGYALTHLADPPLRAAWIEKANPVSQNPNSAAVRQGLLDLDLVVVVDQFLTDTTGVADYVLPAKSLFEQEDLVTAYWHPYVQRRARLLDVPGEVKPESEVWRLLCEQFGFDTRWLPDDPSTLLPGMLPSGCAHLFDRLADEPLDLSARGDVAFADLSFPTPSGKIEFASDEAARMWNVDAVPDYTALGSGLSALGSGPSALGSRTPTSDIGPPTSDFGLRTSDYPLQLLTCKTRDRIHSQFGNIDWIREVERRHTLDMHPDDAAARHLKNGDRASAWNDRGRLDNLVVRIVAGLRPGVVHVLEGRSHKDDPDVNALTDDGVTDMGHGAVFYDCRVEVAARAPKHGWGS
ncbi:MAG: molybdopterin-containing oxidoreductase family protein [Bacteroidales bacterium]